MPSPPLSTVTGVAADQLQVEAQCPDEISPSESDCVEGLEPDAVEPFEPDPVESSDPDEQSANEQFDPEVAGDGLRVNLFLTLDLEMINRVVLPTRTVESFNRLLIYSIVSFHLGMYVGIFLFPNLSKVFRNFLLK